MAAINKPSQPLIPPTDIEDVEGIVAEAIASDDTHAPLIDDKVPAANLPSYVDDVLNFDSAAEFPEEGEEGKIYVANDTNLTYRWSGAAYIQVGGASLAAGDGIDIENDIVSADMEYINDNIPQYSAGSGIYIWTDPDNPNYHEIQGDFANLATTSDLAEVTEAINNLDDAKQDTIDDLDTIRAGAAAGATAVQPGNLDSQLWDGELEVTDASAITTLYNSTQLRTFILSLAEGSYTYKIVTSWYTVIALISIKWYRECLILDLGTVSQPSRIIRMFYNGQHWFSNSNEVLTSYIGNYGGHDYDSQLQQLWDTAPTANSTKPVTSGGIKTALDAKANVSDTYTKAEVDAAINAAIGTALDEEY